MTGMIIVGFGLMFALAVLVGVSLWFNRQLHRDIAELWRINAALAEQVGLLEADPYIEQMHAQFDAVEGASLMVMGD